MQRRCAFRSSMIWFTNDQTPGFGPCKSAMATNRPWCTWSRSIAAMWAAMSPCNNTPTSILSCSACPVRLALEISAIPQQQDRNTAKSRIRACIEHIFGFMTQSTHGLTVRGRSFARNEAVIGLNNIVYNLCRVVKLEKKTRVVRA